jgi:dCMP deaminase
VENNRIISGGYNGFLSGLPHESIVENDHEQATVHSEQNAVSDSAKRGVSCENSIIYITHFPCLNCFKTVASAGINKIIYDEDYKNNQIVYILANMANIKIVKMSEIIQNEIKEIKKLETFDDQCLI